MLLFNPQLRDKSVYASLKAISPKMIVIVLLEFELAYLEAAVKHVSVYDRGTSPSPTLSLTISTLFQLSSTYS